MHKILWHKRLVHGTFRKKFYLSNSMVSSPRPSRLMEGVVLLNQCYHQAKSKLRGEGPSLAQHFVKKSRQRSQICPHCQFSATTINTLRIHIIRKHTMRFKHNCLFCPKGFVTPLMLQIHIKNQHSNETIDNVKKEIKCTQFEKMNNESIDSTHNSPSQSNSKNNCTVCCKLFDNEGELRSHIQEEHSGEETNEPIKEEDASVCDISSDHSHSFLEGHEKLNKKYCCSECPYSTDYITPLKRHLLTHAGERPFQCELCKKAFTQKDHLIRHLRLHTGEQPYVCNACGKRFSNKSNFRNHERVMKGKCHLSRLGGKKPDQSCTQCSYSADCKSHLERHLLTHSGKRLREYHQKPDQKFSCTQCPYFSKLKKNLVRHMLIHSGKRPFQCELCNKTFALKNSLSRHLLVHTGERPYVCPTCGREFRESDKLRSHEGKGECGPLRHGMSPTQPDKKFLCPECPYSTDRKTHFQQHFLIHSGERPYQCELCNRTFRQKSNLNRHRLVHTGELPSDMSEGNFESHPRKKLYQCELCHKAFANKGNLKKHLIVHTGERPYVCNTCGKRFGERSKLRRHEVTTKGKCLTLRHTQRDQKFLCSECPYFTNYKGNLKKHLSTHLRKQPAPKQKHKCDLCDKAFTQIGHLKSHLLVHTGERPFVCNTCGKGFGTKSNMKAHEETHLEERHYPCVCDSCGKGFRNKYKLSRHEVIMKGKCHLSRLRKCCKKFRCKQCPYFADRKSLVERHLLTHSGERPHQSELCDKTFSLKSHLERHHQVHTGKKPYVYHICGKGFSRMCYLHLHKERQHELRKVSEGTSSLFSQDNDPCAPMGGLKEGDITNR